MMVEETGNRGDEGVNNSAVKEEEALNGTESMEVDRCSVCHQQAHAEDENCPGAPKKSLSPPVSPPKQGEVNGSSPCPPISSTTPPEASNKHSVDMDDITDIYEDDDDARPTGTLEFRVPNVSKFKDQDFAKEKKHLSPQVRIRCLPWRILFMLRVSNNVAERGQKCVGFFLQCNADSDSTTWNCHAKVELRLIAQKKDCQDMVRKIEHNYFYKENDWGFSSFLLYADLLNPDNGYVMDDSVLLRVKVHADAPHGVNWDSKRHTGFVGLKNQGATCYMNSLLQTLYFTKKLRKVVYLMPTESDDSARSVALALQRVFYELQHSDRAVGTKKLTRSFGWETLDSFMQHDAQELCRVLMDNMESKMKGTSVEDTIPTLFRGKMLSYIRCKHVNFESKREENFYDIQLKVKGNASVYEAFDDYVSVETLDADNKYDAGDYGLQEAEKGVVFVRFPPVLYLQLMRFQYDHVTDANIKINDRFEFEEKLDLSRFLQRPDRVGATYFLHAVLVHSGDNHGGHYVVYINPKGDNKWFKFDDDVVSRCSRQEAINMNYGGYEEDLGVKLCTNAYMLVYIRESDRDTVLCPLEDADIPQTLRDRFSEERRVEALKRREKAEAHLYSYVHLLLEEDFDGWQGYDLYNPDQVPVRRLRVPKTVNQQQLNQILAETLHNKPERIRPWLVQHRKNQTLRVTCLDLKDNLLSKEGPVNIWVQSLSPDSPLSTLAVFDINEDLLVFFKYFDPRTVSVHYCGCLTIRLHSHISSVLPVLRQRAGLAANAKLMLWEERKPLLIERILNLDVHIEECSQDVMDGNIIIFQEELPDSVAARVPFPTAGEYFRDMHYRVEVTFVDKNIPGDEGFILMLSQKLNYWQMATEVARYLNTEQDMLQFFRAQAGFSYKEAPGQPIRCTFEGLLKELLPAYTRPRSARRLYYQRLGMRIVELECLRQVKCTFVTAKLKEDCELVLNVSKGSQVRDLLEEAAKQVSSSGKLRLLEVVNNRITQEFPEDMKLMQLQSSANRTLRVEEVPAEELHVSDTEAIVYVAHFHKDSFATFGVPFTVKVRDGEPFSAVRERIQRRLEVSDKEMEKWRFAVVASRASYLPEDEETTVRTSVFTAAHTTGTNRPWLGLEHNLPPKRARIVVEKPIKIHN